jgi:hypothetical protein
MSTVKATNLQNASSSVANAVTTSGGDLTNAAGVSFMGGSKNLLYNGAMQVAQRGTSTSGISVAPSGDYYTADRWKFLVNALGTWTETLETDAPSGIGFRNSLKVLCTANDASPAAGDYLIVTQRLEGQDLQRLMYGTASAQQVTLSFWVKSNVTGTYIAELRDTTAGKNAGAAYTISSAATWERKVITFPGNTADVLANDNLARIELNFWLGAGSTFTSGTLGSAWQSTTANRAAGQTNLAAATNNYWQVTGVQLEVGPVATTFEFKSFGQELRECQRYYQKSYNVTVSPGTVTDAGAAIQRGINSQVPINVFLRTTLRTTPTSASFYSPVTGTVDRIRNLSQGSDITAPFNFLGDSVCSGNPNGTTNDLYSYHWVVSAEL